MKDWDTSRLTLDPNLTAIALRGRAHPDQHWVQVRAWEARRRRRRVLADAILGALILGLTVGLWYAALAWLEGRP